MQLILKIKLYRIPYKTSADGHKTCRKKVVQNAVGTYRMCKGQILYVLLQFHSSTMNYIQLYGLVNDLLSSETILKVKGK